MRRSTSAAVMQRSTSSLSYCDVELRKGTAHLVFFFFVKNISYVFERISMVSEHISSKILYIARKNASPHFNENNLLKYIYCM